MNLQKVIEVYMRSVVAKRNGILGQINIALERYLQPFGDLVKKEKKQTSSSEAAG